MPRVYGRANNMLPLSWGGVGVGQKRNGSELCKKMHAFNFKFISKIDIESKNIVSLQSNDRLQMQYITLKCPLTT